ncbi:protein KTI12 homolog [Stylophora pistillata]|uniref:Protein KTI12 homolog n=1 Tax=Stylophora pistillata TaxID=50429 RepID=A0A2B4RL31_STYPI|nr:protein KTI12 homolog [Stylophora pistillata]PFX17876.1 Protein KTI12-like [Stylophora pistillata]
MGNPLQTGGIYMFKMPLIIMCGFPCSGKSKRAHELKNYLENRGKTVHLAGDDNNSLDRNGVYSASVNEKEARGLLKSAVERLISRDDIVILDSLNYIKGYRYELYCVAKAHKTTHCIVHCDTSKEICSGWNKTREKRYNDEILDALIMRFEPPESRNRWDSPLFVIQVDDDLPFDSIYDALVNRVPPPPNQATQPQPLSATNFLYELDKITQEIVTALINSQRTFVPGDHITVPGTSEKVILNRTAHMAELRKIRRQFITYTKMHPVEDTKKIANMFVQYLNSSLQ